MILQWQSSSHHHTPVHALPPFLDACPLPVGKCGSMVKHIPTVATSSKGSSQLKAMLHHHGHLWCSKPFLNDVTGDFIELFQCNASRTAFMAASCAS